ATNGTLAVVVSAVKMHVPVAHLEAGLRAFNRRLPEEHNRVLTDHAADLLLAPTLVAMDHLAKEGLADRSVLVGDVMTDVLYAVRARVADRAGRPGEGSTGEGSTGEGSTGDYLVCTVHRADNTDDRDRLRTIVGALAGRPLP